MSASSDDRGNGVVLTVPGRAPLEGEVTAPHTPAHERILGELEILREGGQDAALVIGDREVVIYLNVATAGAVQGLPATADVVVPVPPGYPAAQIDLAGLTQGSALLPRLRGGQNNQGVFRAGGTVWQLASYHPHNNGGAPPYDPMRHGFHTYLAEVLSWLHRID